MICNKDLNYNYIRPCTFDKFNREALVYSLDMDIAALRRTAILAETTNRFKVTMNNGFLLGLECGNVKIIRKKLPLLTLRDQFCSTNSVTE